MRSRSRCALYVDAGYLLASAATRVTGTSLRGGIHVEYAPMIRSLIDQAEQIAGVPVLRVHWYDSAKDGVPDYQQERIGELPKVKLRLGRFGVDGQQKGVDVRIGLDLVAHARNGTADVFFLVSGDDDLTEAVEDAQVHGVQVIVLAVPTRTGKPHGVSKHLIRAADELVTVLPAAIDRAVLRRAEPAAPAPTAPVVPPAPPRAPTPADVIMRGPRQPAAPASSVLAYSASTGSRARTYVPDQDLGADDERIDAVVVNVLAAFRQSAGPEELEALEAGRPSIPGTIDRALLTDLSEALGILDLSDQTRFRLRDRFWRHYGGQLP